MNKPINMKELMDKLETINEDTSKQDRFVRNERLLIKSFDQELNRLIDYTWTRAEQIAGNNPGLIAATQDKLKSILKEYV